MYKKTWVVNVYTILDYPMMTAEIRFMQTQTSILNNSEKKEEREREREREREIEKSRGLFLQRVSEREKEREHTFCTK